MSPKLLILDIDGTIVKEHKNMISPMVINALRLANDIVEIATMSARAWKDQKIIIDLLQLSNFYHVIENGSKVINPQGVVDYSNTLSNSDIDKIVKNYEVRPESAGCVDGKWIRITDISEDAVISTLSLISHNTNPPSIDALKTKYSITLGEHWDNPDFIVTLVSHKKASKGSGVKYIQEQTGISLAETIVVGDGASDVSAMQYAGVKIAMGNSEPILKEIADYIAPSVGEDGLADIVKKFILE